MLGRKTYTQEELDNARTAVDRQLAAYKRLAGAVSDSKALEAFEPLFAGNLVLALDRWFVHRIRAVAGKDGNPLNEVELLADSLMAGDGVLRGNNVIKLVADQSVLGLDVGDRIELSVEQFERLAKAFFAEIETKFLAPTAT